MSDLDKIAAAWRAAKERADAAAAEEKALRARLFELVDPALDAAIAREGKPYSWREFGGIRFRRNTYVRWDSEALLNAAKSDREIRAALKIQAKILEKKWSSLSERARNSVINARTVKQVTAIWTSDSEPSEE